MPGWRQRVAGSPPFHTSRPQGSKTWKYTQPVMRSNRLRAVELPTYSRPPGRSTRRFCPAPRAAGPAAARSSRKYSRLTSHEASGSPLAQASAAPCRAGSTAAGASAWRRMRSSSDWYRSTTCSLAAPQAAAAVQARHHVAEGAGGDQHGAAFQVLLGHAGDDGSTRRLYCPSRMPEISGWWSTMRISVGRCRPGTRGCAPTAPWRHSRPSKAARVVAKKNMPNKAARRPAPAAPRSSPGPTTTHSLLQYRCPGQL